MASKVTSSIKLHEDEDYDCGTKNFLVFDICKENKNILSHLKGMVFRIDDDTSKDEYVCDGKSDYKELKGHTIYVRSPATCAGKDDKVCRKCYGERYYMNKDIHIGYNASLNLWRHITQKSLGAKHILNTSSSKITFDDTFKKFFRLTDGYILDVKKKIDLRDLKFLIPVNGIFDKDEMEEAFNEGFDHFVIEYKKEKYKIKENNDMFFYLSEPMYEIYLNKRKYASDKNKYIIITGKEIYDKEIDLLMFMKLINDEITKPLKKLRLLVEKGAVIEGTYQDIIEKFSTYLEQAGIHGNFSDISIIIKNLIKGDSPHSSPDWTKKNPEYSMTSINNAIKTSSSIVDTLTFEDLRRQLKYPSNYTKDGTSIYDHFFINTEDINMEPYIDELNKKVMEDDIK